MNGVLQVEIRDEFRAIYREPMALIFSVLLPVAFYGLFTTMFGSDAASGGLPIGTTMLATMGTFGVVAVTLGNPGISVAGDREIGWLRTKRIAAVEPTTTVLAKVVAAMPYALGVILAMGALSAVTGVLDAPPLALLRVAGVLLIGSVPFALLGLAVGFQLRTQATAAVTQVFLMPAAVVSGLWMPHEILPPVMADIAPYLPTYHLAQLALAQLEGTGGVAHAGILAGMSVVIALAAVLSYRHVRP